MNDRQGRIGQEIGIRGAAEGTKPGQQGIGRAVEKIPGDDSPDAMLPPGFPDRIGGAEDGLDADWVTSPQRGVEHAENGWGLGGILGQPGERGGHPLWWRPDGGNGFPG